MATDGPDHEFLGVVTKLRTTRGSQFALDTMSEAADRIEQLLEALDDVQAAYDRAVQEYEPHEPVMDQLLSELVVALQHGKKKAEPRSLLEARSVDEALAIYRKETL